MLLGLWRPVIDRMCETKWLLPFSKFGFEKVYFEKKSVLRLIIRFCNILLMCFKVSVHSGMFVQKTVTAARDIPAGRFRNLRSPYYPLQRD